MNVTTTLHKLQDDLVDRLMGDYPEHELDIVYNMGLGEIVEICHDYDLLGLDEEGRGPETMVVEGYLVIEDYILIIPKLLEEEYQMEIYHLTRTDLVGYLVESYEDVESVPDKPLKDMSVHELMDRCVEFGMGETEQPRNVMVDGVLVLKDYHLTWE
jgi:hypothetical protein